MGLPLPVSLFLWNRGGLVNELTSSRQRALFTFGVHLVQRSLSAAAQHTQSSTPCQQTFPCCTVCLVWLALGANCWPNRPRMKQPERKLIINSCCCCKSNINVYSKQLICYIGNHSQLIFLLFEIYGKIYFSEHQPDSAFLGLFDIFSIFFTHAIARVLIFIVDKLWRNPDTRLMMILLLQDDVLWCVKVFWWGILNIKLNIVTLKFFTSTSIRYCCP